ncbi:MAG: hypothetical protein VKJ02_15715 [Snowella sp.]|nr:hypothetical protein [Snowella sp.]
MFKKSFTPSRFVLPAGLIVGLIAGLIGEVAQAQLLRVSPLVIQTQAEKGQARSSVEFTNIGNNAYRARIYAMPFTYNRDGLKNLKSSPQDLTPYLTFSPRELVLEPNQTRTVRLNARFAPTVPDGEYRVMLYADPLNEIDPANPTPAVTLRTRLGITVYVRKGDLAPNLVVQQATYNPQKKQILLLTRNSGSATTRPKAQWKISQGKQEIAVGRLEETTVIAGSDRYLTIPYPPPGKKLTPGTYQLSGQLEWSFPKTGTLTFNVPLTISEQDVQSLNRS